MSGELIEGLRSNSHCDAPGPSGRRCGKCYRCLRRRAADEITRLRAELSSLRGEGCRHGEWEDRGGIKCCVFCGLWFDHASPDSDVIGRLVGALEIIRKLETASGGGMTSTQCAEVARQALASIPTPDDKP